MREITINGYRRISKGEARKLYAKGIPLRICAVNMSPVNIWGAYSDIGGHIPTKEKAFNDIMNAFVYYNCNAETGIYPAFYIKEEGNS